MSNNLVPEFVALHLYRLQTESVLSEEQLELVLIYAMGEM